MISSVVTKMRAEKGGNKVVNGGDEAQNGDWIVTRSRRQRELETEH